MHPSQLDWSQTILDDGSLLGLPGPAAAALPRTLRAHAAAREAAGGDSVAALAVSEHDLTHLGTGDLPLHLAVSGGAGALEAALRWATEQGSERVTLRRVSVRMRGEADLAHQARRILTVLDSVTLPDDLAVHAAPPEPTGGLSPAWLSALDELATREVGLLLPARAPWTGAAVDAALDRELPMAFTGESAEDVVTAMTTVRTQLAGEPPPEDWLREDPELAARTRRWCTAVVVPDLGAVLAGL